MKEQKGKISEYWAIVFTDLVDSTNLNYLIGDEEYSRLIEYLDSWVRNLTFSFKGEFIKSLGDGFFLAFPEVKKAVEFAIKLQEGIDRKKKEISQPISMRIGIHFGTPIYDEKKNDWIGIDVSIASRVCAKADGGKIYITEAIYNLFLGIPELTQLTTSKMHLSAWNSIGYVRFFVS